MKRVLSLVLALVLVLGMIPTFAADMTAGQHLFEHEFIAGDGMGNLNEDQLLTREQLAKLILELNGSKEEAEALTLPPSFTDSAKISAWARPYVAYAQIEGLMVGFSDGSFRPQEGVTGQQLAAVLTRALGYEFEWATVLADAADLGIEVAAVAKLTRGEAFEAMWTTVNTKPEGEATLTLGQKLGKLDPPPAPVAFAVESVTATNLKEIVVTFNKDVDVTTAEDPTSYVVTRNAATVVTTASADGNVVTLTLATQSAQQDTATVKVQNVKAADDMKALTTVTKTVSFFDVTVPQASSVQVTGPTTLVVNFSEPMATVPTFKVDNGTYFASVAFTAGSNKATLTLGVALPEGAHTVEVTGGTDYAGFAIAKTPLAFTYVKDVAAPIPTVSKSTETVVTIKFDKAVKATNINTDVTGYHTYNNTAAYKGTLAAVSPDANGYSKTYTLTFTTPIPQGNHTIYLNAAANKFEDLWGNDVATTQLTATVVTDIVKPEVVSVVAKSDKKIEVTFSEDVLQADAVLKTNYILKDASGAVVKTATYADVDNNGNFNANATITYTDKVATITMTNPLPGASYNLTVEKVKDLAFVKNTMDSKTFTFLVGDTTAPTLSKALVNTTFDKVLVYFNEPMSTEGLTSAANYQYVLDGASAAALPANSTVTIVDTKTVQITLGTALANTFGAGGNDKIVVSGNLADVSNNKLGGFYKEVAVTSDAIGLANISAVKATALNTITFVVDRELSSIDVTKFTVDGTASSVSGSTYVNASGSSTVTLTVNTANEAIGTDLSGVTTANLVNLSAGALTSTFGTTSTAFDIAKAAATQDKIAPTLVSKELTGTTTIVMTYSEAIKAASVSIYTYTVAGNTVSNVAVAGSAVTITLGTAVAVDATPSVTQALDIEDANGNKLVSSGAVTVVDKIAPTVATRTSTTLTGVVITLSEALNVTDGTDVKAAFSITDTDTSGAVTITSATYNATAKTITFVIGAGVTATDLLVTNGSLTDVAGNALAAGTIATADATDLAQ